MGAAKTISAGEFRATCLDVLDRVESGEFSRVEVTRDGQVVAVVTRPPATPAQARALHGALRGRVIIPPGLDLTAPISEGPSDAELGILHR
jgi:antitoxin (DNA-binding transcriptional repressor) of toxin-antitoxin stability system